MKFGIQYMHSADFFDSRHTTLHVLSYFFSCWRAMNIDIYGVPKISNGTSRFPKDLRNSTVTVCPKPQMGLVDFLKFCVIQRLRCAQNLKWD